MSLTAAVAGLAVRELWVSFRLLVVLAASALPGTLVALLPGSRPESLDRFAVALAAGGVLTAVVAAGALATERARGSAGWLVARAVPRGTLLAGWFVALTGAALAGLIPGAGLGWLATSATRSELDQFAFAAAATAAGASTLAGLALGLLAGAVFGPRMAVAATLLACAGVAAASVALPAAGEYLPGAGYLAMATLPQVAEPIGRSLQAAGASLAATALLLILTRAALEQADL